MHPRIHLQGGILGAKKSVKGHPFDIRTRKNVTFWKNRPFCTNCAHIYDGFYPKGPFIPTFTTYTVIFRRGIRTKTQKTQLLHVFSAPKWTYKGPHTPKIVQNRHFYTKNMKNGLLLCTPQRPFTLLLHKNPYFFTLFGQNIHNEAAPHIKSY